MIIYPFGYLHRVYSTFDQNFDFKVRKEHKKFPMSPTPMSR